MAVTPERITLNPTSESSANRSLELVGLNTDDVLFLIDHDYPPAGEEVQRQSSVDGEGEMIVNVRPGNRLISLRVRISEPGLPASTNLVPNPDGAVDASSWAGVSLVTGPTRVVPATIPSAGSRADTAIEATMNADADYLYVPVAVQNGTTYRLSAYVQLSAETGAAGLRLAVYNATPTKKATGATSITAAGEGWVRLDVSFTADSTATWRVGVEQVGAGTATAWITGVLCETSASLGPFFDGDSPGCSWTGTPGVSTSTRPASGGPYFWAAYEEILSRIDSMKGGTYRRIPPDGEAIIFDVLRAEITDVPQDTGIPMRRAEIGIAFECKPHGRGPEYAASAVVDEAVLPVLSLPTNVPIKGDVSALGRLVVTERATQNQARLLWGLRSLYNDGLSEWVDATTRTTIGTATVSGGAVQAFGSDSLLTPAFSTQASGGGAHLAHVGDFRVFARAQAPTAGGASSRIALDWADGDLLRRTVNSSVSLSPGANASGGSGAIRLIDLGLVRLRAGRWEGKVLVAGGNAAIFGLLLMPVAEGGGDVNVAPSLVPSSYASVDPLSGGASSALVTRNTVNVGLGGIWAGGGDADDFFGAAAFGFTDRYYRNFNTDTAARVDWLPTSLTATLVSVDVQTSAYSPNGSQQLGVIARAASATDYIYAFLSVSTLSTSASTLKIGGIGTVVGSVQRLLPFAATAGAWYTITLLVDVAGRCYAWVTPQGVRPTGTPDLIWAAQAALATGGARAAGFAGIYDNFAFNPGNPVRYYQNFKAYAPVQDAALFSGRQLEVRSDSVRRQDSGAAIWGNVAAEGDYLYVPQSGPANRSSRIAVAVTRGAYDDPAIDPLRAQLYVTPRYRVVPPVGG